MIPAAQAVEALIHQYGKLVFHTIYGLTGDWEESQDLTQDTFQQALKGIEAARAASGAAFNPRAWLLKIALNTVRMQQRRKRLLRFVPFSGLADPGKREQEQEGERLAEHLSSQAAPVQPQGYGASASSDPGELIAERDAVQRTLRRLPEPLRVCLLLSTVANFSTAEIAQMLDLNEPAVRQRLVRARRQFRELYALERGDESPTRAPALPEEEPDAASHGACSLQAQPPAQRQPADRADELRLPSPPDQPHQARRELRERPAPPTPVRARSDREIVYAYGFY
jgi:RNA polymerase sigma factor (sigma-70 family)